jgi:hypothetical protein
MATEPAGQPGGLPQHEAQRRGAQRPAGAGQAGGQDGGQHEQGDGEQGRRGQHRLPAPLEGPAQRLGLSGLTARAKCCSAASRSSAWPSACCMSTAMWSSRLATGR